MCVMSKMAELDRQRGEYEKIVAIYTWFFPKQEGIPIPEKYYNLNQIVGLLREHKNEPEVVQFIADMLEI